MNEELAMCAQVNFENLEKAFPPIMAHPYYRVAKAQLDEALGIRTMEEALGPIKEIGSATFKDGKWETTGIIKSVTEE